MRNKIKVLLIIVTLMTFFVTVFSAFIYLSSDIDVPVAYVVDKTLPHPGIDWRPYHKTLPVWIIQKHK